jgi:hypothetical protein
MAFNWVETPCGCRVQGDSSLSVQSSIQEKGERRRKKEKGDSEREKEKKKGSVKERKSRKISDSPEKRGVD